MQVTLGILAEVSQHLDFVGIANMVVSAFLTLAVAWVGNKVSRIEKLEDKLTEATGDLVDQKIELLKVGESACREETNRRLGEMNERLGKGETRFRLTDERVHQIEKELLREISALKDIVATKQDIRDLKKEMGNG